tara:strand:- start:2332 stop:2496 length:165 start_codon:yes stop_codon:yes gene_type:complete
MMSLFTIAGFALLAWALLDLRRQVGEIGEEVGRMHKDFLAEVYLRYSEEADGEE